MGILSGRKSAEHEAATPAPAGLSVIAAGMAVRGDLDSNGIVRVEGSVDGNVTTRAQALVAKGGVVHGDVSAEEVVVGGAVTGAVLGRTRVEIQAGAVVEGDVTTQRILVAEGAMLNGRVRMGESTTQASHGSSEGGADSGPAMATHRTSVPVARVAVPPRQPLS